MRRDYPEFEARDTLVVSVGPEGAREFQDYWGQHDLPFVGLPDPEHSVLKLYGQEVNLFKLGRQPAQMIIDKTGTLRYVHYGHTMADIPSNEELLKILDSLEDESGNGNGGP